MSLPQELTDCTDGERLVELEGRTAREVLVQLGRRWPPLAPRLFDDKGELRRHMTVCIEGEELRGSGGLDATVAEGQTLYVLSPVAGG